MDISTLTPAQRDCVTHVRGPLLVSAGAGSGKTLMLTQRIAYALLHPRESDVTDIDQVLAITFTDAAASEIKTRVRNTLCGEGLAQQALKVDSCWIGTIHGMCARILRENALDLGVDPQFSLLDDTDRDSLLEECVNAALAETRGDAAEDGEDAGGEAGDDGAAYGKLFREYEKADGSSNVGKMAADLITAASNLRGGLNAITCRSAPSPHDVARDAHDAMVSCDAVAREGIGKNGKAKETFTVNARAALEDPERGMPAFERLTAKTDCSHEEVALALAGVDLAFGSRTSKEPYATAYAVFKQEYVRAAEACMLGLAQDARGELLAFTRRVWEIYEQEKSRRGLFDQDDLLLKTLDAFETRPAVEARYRDRFKLVMVDEFQDTSGLQVALIEHLTGGNRRLCTVGDTQQSIYRFRGADVATYRAHKQTMRGYEAEDGLYRELDRNFRSHGDIIAFVNRVFGAPEVFGGAGEFIELDALADHAAHNPFPDVPRVDIVATTNARCAGVSVGDRVYVEAEAIARRMEALHADAPNQRWSDMVILLGTMGRADTYAGTLRAHGIPCIVSGGSGFSNTAEARDVAALLAAVADPWDDTNLRIALSGGAFGLGAEDLLRLGAAPDGSRRHLWDGLLDISEGDPSPRVRLAGALLEDAVAQGGARGAAATLTELAVASGWLDRLQGQGAQGMAGAANILKAIRLVESIEAEDGAPRGIPATAARFSRKIATGMKEKPGSLMARGQDAVRIMTIHASKGLEFPVVALASFYGTHSETDRLRMETADDRVYLSLLPSASTAEGTPLHALAATKLSPTQAQRLADAGLSDNAPDLFEAEDAVDLNRAIRAHNAVEELGELRRKFYVGATRPREALIVAVNMETSEKRGINYGGVLDDLRRAVFGETGDYVTAPEGIDFGGLRRATTQRMVLERDDDGRLLVNGKPGTEYLQPEAIDAVDPCDLTLEGTSTSSLVPEVPGPGESLRDLLPGRRPCDPLHAGTFSYSAVAPRPVQTAHGSMSDKQGPVVEYDPDEARVDGVDAKAADRETGAAETSGDLGANGIEGGMAAGNGDGAEESPAERARRAAATAFGSALHQACQLMAEDLAARRAAGQTGHPGDPEAKSGTPDATEHGLAIPSDDRLRACLHAWGAPAARLGALRAAVARWAESKTAREAASFPDVQPEAPFYVTLQGPQGEPLHLTGFIDLLCRDLARPALEQDVLVVDYKTGGSPAETADALADKHALQAKCYAYAVLACGYRAVNLRFVRVQQQDAVDPRQPQVVSYRYGRAQLQELAEDIRAAYATARAVTARSRVAP